jgi:hypothetical protein
LVVGEGEASEVTYAGSTVPVLVCGAATDSQADIVYQESVGLRTDADSQPVVDGSLRAGNAGCGTTNTVQKVVVGQADAGCSVKILIGALALAASSIVVSVVIVAVVIVAAVVASIISIVASIIISAVPSVITAASAVGDVVVVRRDEGSGYTQIIDQRIPHHTRTFPTIKKHVGSLAYCSDLIVIAV